MIQAMANTISAIDVTMPKAQPGRQPQPVQPEPVLSEASPISSVTYSSPSGRIFIPPSRGGFFDLRRFANPIFFDLEGLLDLEERILNPLEREGLETEREGFMEEREELLLERLEPLDLRTFFISVTSQIDIVLLMHLCAALEFLPPFVLG